jgi:hypothetical protein
MNNRDTYINNITHISLVSNLALYVPENWKWIRASCWNIHTFEREFSKVDHCLYFKGVTTENGHPNLYCNMTPESRKRAVREPSRGRPLLENSSLKHSKATTDKFVESRALLFSITCSTYEKYTWRNAKHIQKRQTHLLAREDVIYDLWPPGFSWKNALFVGLKRLGAKTSWLTENRQS